MTTEPTIGPMPGPLAALLEQGHALTYAPAAGTGGVFADLRGPSGRVIETGLGRTAAEALEDLAARVGRPTADGHLRELLGRAYEVTLISGGSPDGDSYWAHVRLGGGPLYTAEGRTPMEAIWAASPLHSDDELFPGEPLTCARCGHGWGDHAHEAAGALVPGKRSCSLCGRAGYAEAFKGDAPAPSPFANPCGDVVCRHGRDSHWEHAEPDGPRVGCAILGCPCMAYVTPA